MRRIVLAGALVALTLSACANVLGTGEGSEPGPPGYEEHRARWTNHGLETYSFSMYLGSFEGPRGPFCGETHVRIGVEKGVPSAVRRPFGCVVDPADPALEWVPFTMDELFDLIKENDISAGYDENLGYPRDIVSEGRITFRGKVVFPAKGSGFELFVNDFASGSSDVGSTDEVLAELAQQRQIWGSQAIDTYQMHVERICFCPPASYLVVVDAGTVVSVSDAKGVFPLDSEELRGFPLTVTKLFAEVERQASADAIQVTYDAELGYPTKIAVDPITNAIDDEVTFAVTGFRSG